MAGLVHIKVKSAAIVDENQDLEDELRNIKERHEDESYSTFQNLQRLETEGKRKDEEMLKTIAENYNLIDNNKELQYQIQQERSSSEQLKVQIQQERSSSEQLKVQMQKERNSSEQLQVQVQKERMTSEQLQSQISKERNQSSQLQVQLQNQINSSNELAFQIEKVRNERPAVAAAPPVPTAFAEAPPVPPVAEVTSAYSLAAITPEPNIAAALSALVTQGPPDPVPDISPPTVFNTPPPSPPTEQIRTPTPSPPTEQIRTPTPSPPTEQTTTPPNEPAPAQQPIVEEVKQEEPVRRSPARRPIKRKSPAKQDDDLDLEAILGTSAPSLNAIRSRFKK